MSKLPVNTNVRIKFFSMYALPPAMLEAFNKIRQERINRGFGWFDANLNSLSPGAQNCWTGFTCDNDDWEELFNCFGVLNTSIYEELYETEVSKKEIKQLIDKLEL